VRVSLRREGKKGARAMRKSRFSVEQIVYALKLVESRQVSVGDQCRKLGASDQTFYQWRKKYAGLAPSRPGR